MLEVLHADAKRLSSNCIVDAHFFAIMLLVSTFRTSRQPEDPRSDKYRSPFCQTSAGLFRGFERVLVLLLLSLSQPYKPTHCYCYRFTHATCTMLAARLNPASAAASAETVSCSTPKRSTKNSFTASPSCVQDVGLAGREARVGSPAATQLFRNCRLFRIANAFGCACGLLP